jgi:hypothetical protein
MAKKQTSAAKQKKAKLKVSKKLYKAFRKEAKKKDLALSTLALEISERGIRKRKIKSVIDSVARLRHRKTDWFCRSHLQFARADEVIE